MQSILNHFGSKYYKHQRFIFFKSISLSKIFCRFTPNRKVFLVLRNVRRALRRKIYQGTESKLNSQENGCCVMSCYLQAQPLPKEIRLKVVASTHFI
jgi:hypothetical protein